MAASPFSVPVVFTIPEPDNDSFSDAHFGASSALGAAGTSLPGWCVRLNAPITYNVPYTGYIYSSYEILSLKTNLPGLYLDNLDSVNWLLSYYRSGTTGFTATEVQGSIWQLMHQFGGPNTALTELALAHDGYVPDAGEVLAVVIDPVRADGTHEQTSIVETKAAKLGDRVWEDGDADGIQDAGEAGIAGATVQLVRDLNGDGKFTAAGEILASTTTDANGNYSFKGLTPGLDYQVQFTQPAGYDAASARQADGTSASGVNSDGKVSDHVVLQPGEYNATIDSGFYKFASIGDRVWTDTNGNGVQDAGEAGQPGVKVQLYTCVDGAPGKLVATQTTDANGNYNFTNLKPGDYILKFVASDGSILTTVDVGNDALDSDAGAKGLTGCYTLASGEHNTSVDAGFYQGASLGDRVWSDVNANGVQDAGESGLGGVKVQLYTCVDGAPGTLVGTKTTDANGNYSFTKLQPGDYMVKFIAPNGSVLSTANVGSDAFDSDAGADGFTGCYTLVSGENNATVDAGIYKTASIGDKVWHDLNANGVQDAGEGGKAGVTVELYTCVDGQPGELVASKVTGSSGAYNFTGLKPGDYMVKFIAADGSVLSTSNVGADELDSDAGANGLTGCYTLAAGENNTTVDAGFYKTASLGDKVWNDTNGNGIQNANESGKAGVTVELYTCVNDAPGVLVATQVTDAAGNYNFTGLKPGDYVVKFIAADGSVLTTANAGTNDGTDSDADANGLTGCYTLTSGQTNKTVDAGFVKPPPPALASLGDRVWNDANANGVQDAGETGKAGVKVELYTSVNGAPGTLVATQTTDANGNYAFTGLQPGNYTVKFIAADGSVLSSANVGSDALDSDAGSNGFTGTYTLAAGENNPTVDAGYYKTASLGDRVWNDNNGNGVQDTGETGKAGVTVELYTCGVDDAPGELVATQVTDANGNYSFTGLKPGDYMLKFIAADGSVLSTANVGSDALDSDAGANGFTGCYTLVSGENNTTADAGFVKPAPPVLASLGDRVWNDSNANGVQDAGETGKAGVIVNLYTSVNDAPGAFVAATVTDASGNYRFGDLPAGQYLVQFIATDGSVLSSANVGNDALDSDAGANGLTGTYTLAAGEHNPTVDAGYYKTASLGDRVWNDANANGVQDAGEAGKAGVTVELYTSVNGAAGTLVTTQTTDANGSYGFAGLKPGDYMVKFIANDGTVLSTANVGSDSLDSDAGANGFTGTYTLVAGENNPTVDAGFYKTASLGDRVWNDSNANGVQDAGETGKAGVVVQLYTSVNGAPSLLVGSTATDANGNYAFNGLKPGDYVVQFIATDGSVLSTANVGSDTLDSDAGTNGFTGSYTLAAGEHNPTVDAGYYKTASLGDRVWNDNNGNGVQDAGESGKAGVTVELYTCGADDQPGALVATQVTDANGNYGFSGLKPGDYMVKFIASDGTVLSTANVGNDALDSDAGSNGFTGCYTLASGESNTTVDAGFRPKDSIVNPDQAQVCEDRSTSFNVLANDLGEGLKLVGVSHETAALQAEFASRGGALSFTADGQVTYKSMTDYYGFDKLVYTVQDASGKQFTQTVDMTVHAVSDAPTAGAGVYNHPGSWTYYNGAVWGYTLTPAIFGSFSDAKDQLQQFGTYNTGVANDVDTLRSIVITGVNTPAGQPAVIKYNGVTVDLSGDNELVVSSADIAAGKVVLEMYGAYVSYGLQWHYRDDGSVDNDACYDGTIDSNGNTTIILTPIALDLNGDGQIGVTGSTSSSQKDDGAAIGRTVQFDMNADGKLDTIEWFNGSGDGILIDNRDGGAAAHMDGSRLFGDQGGHDDGYAKLRQFDANGDGQLSGSELAGIELWVDNGDAVVQAGEIQTLAQHGIVALSTEVSLFSDAESRVHLQSSATRADGSTLMSEDVFFLQALPAASELLAADNSLDSLLGTSASTHAAPSGASDVTDVSQAAELLRKLSAQMEAHAAA